MITLGRYINPLTDFGFKKLFGEEVNKDLLLDFLNQLLPAKHQIKDLSYMQNEHQPSAEYDRKAVYDIYCEGQTGEKFIVEIQRAKQHYFKDRSLYYASFPIQQQAQRGGTWDFRLAAIYTIGILDFVFEEDKDEPSYIHTVQLKDQQNRVFYDKLSFIYIELPKFTEQDPDKLETKIEKWLYVFRHLAKLQDRPRALQERVFEKLFAAAEIAKYSPKERQGYEESLKLYWDWKNVLDTARDEAKMEGKIEGKMEGKMEGQIEIAKSMKADGLPLDLIAKYTGLSAKDLEGL